LERSHSCFHFLLTCSFHKFVFQANLMLLYIEWKMYLVGWIRCKTLAVSLSKPFSRQFLV
jgi:hypothetical protein